MKCEYGSTTPSAADAARSADHAVAGAGDQLDPDLVGVDGALAERVADREGPDHDLDQVLAAGSSRGDLRAQGPQEPAVDHAAVAQAEDVDPHLLVAQEPGVPLGGLLVAREGGQAGVGADEEVVVDLAAALAVEVAAPKSLEAFSSMWHSTHVDLATSG